MPCSIGQAVMIVASGAAKPTHPGNEVAKRHENTFAMAEPTLRKAADDAD